MTSDVKAFAEMLSMFLKSISEITLKIEFSDLEGGERHINLLC